MLLCQLAYAGGGATGVWPGQVTGFVCLAALVIVPVSIALLRMLGGAGPSN